MERSRDIWTRQDKVSFLLDSTCHYCSDDHDLEYVCKHPRTYVSLVSLEIVWWGLEIKLVALLKVTA